MGREVKRVALDFDAPRTAWAGYIRPSEGVSNCAVCDGMGQSPFANLLQKRWYGQGVDYTQMGDDAGAHRWTPEDPEVRQLAQKNVMQSPGYYVYGRIGALRDETPLTQDDLSRSEVRAAITHESVRLAGLFNETWMYRLSEADLEAILAAEYGIPPHLTGTFDREAKVWVPFEPAPTFTARQISAMNMGWAQIGQRACMDRVIRESGESWDCPNPDCHNGTVYDSPEIKAALDAWERTEPPAGEGWQMWQTVSDGPISPVFSSPEALADYMALSLRYSDGLSAKRWLQFITGPGWAPSASGLSGGDILPNAAGLLARQGESIADIFSDVDE